MVCIKGKECCKIKIKLYKWIDKLGWEEDKVGVDWWNMCVFINKFGI